MNFDEVQFDHDNRLDYLTGAEVPMTFYRHLMRTIEARKRNGGTLFMVAVKVLPPKKELKPGTPAAKRQIAEFEEALGEANRLIKKNLRIQDFYTRMAVDGFYILISGDKDDESKLLERFKKVFADRSLYKVVAVRLIGDLTPTEWLTQVDEIYFGENSR